MYNLYLNLKYRTNINNNYNIFDLDICKELINKNINSLEYISSGGQADVFKVSSNKCGSIVLKRYKDFDEKYSNNEIFDKEVEILSKTNKLIENNICPNYIYLFDYKKQNTNSYYLMEYADGDSSFLFTQKNISNQIYDTFVFQVLAGIYFLEKNLNIINKDIKPENILFKKINKDTFLNYKINNIDYSIPTYGYLFMISDFGIVIDLNSEKNIELKQNYTLDRFYGGIIMLYRKIILKEFNTLDKFLNILPKSVYLLVKKKYKLNDNNFKNIVIYVVYNKLINLDKFILNKKINWVMDIFQIKNISIEEILFSYFKNF